MGILSSHRFLNQHHPVTYRIRIRIQHPFPPFAGPAGHQRRPPELAAWGGAVGRLSKATFIRISIHLYSSNVVTGIQTQLDNKQENILNLCLLLSYIIVRRVYSVLGSYYLQYFRIYFLLIAFINFLSVRNVVISV